MSKKKYYLVTKYETKEEFEKRFDKIWDSGYERGYQAGLTEAVSYIWELLDHFPYAMQQNAKHVKGERDKAIAMANMNKGVVPVVPDDPAIREMRKQVSEELKWKKFVKETLSEESES